MKSYDFHPPPDGDRDQGWAILSVCWAFVAAAFLTTLLRIYVRVRLTRNLGWDDYSMIAAITTTLIGAGLVTCEVIVGGLGRHSFYLEQAQKRNFAALGWADWIQTWITLMFTKISICLFLLRIVDHRRTRHAIYGLIGCLVLFTIVYIALFLGICRPLKAYWEVGVDAICFSDTQVEWIVLSQGVLSIVTDLMLAVFPAFFLRGLQVKIKTKIALCVLMGLGVITAACCTVRTVLSGAVKDPDITWAISASVGWRLPEVNIGIVCANAPIFRPLYLYFQGRLSTQQWSSRTYASNRKILPKQGSWVSHLLFTSATIFAIIPPGTREQFFSRDATDSSATDPEIACDTAKR